jgi:hypothetical protein
MTDEPKLDGEAPQEEELDIVGPSPAPPPTQGQEQSRPESVNKMDQQVGHLDLGPGVSNEDFVNQLLQTPTETLIPWEECHLPSRGMYYGWEDGMILVRAMGQSAEKILATQRLAQSGQSIDYLLRENCQFPEGFDSTELLLGDRVFILYFLRGITFGNLYEFVITCPSCNATNTHTYDLNELAQTIVWSNPSLGHEPFRVSLPYLSKASGREVWVGVRFLRAVDSNDMLARRKVHKKLFARPGGARTRQKGPVDPRVQSQQRQVLDETITESMEKIIVSVMGVSDPFTVKSFVSKLHSQDTTAIRDWLRDNTPGIDNTIEVECPDCNTVYKSELPITDSFFRSTGAGDI